MINPVDCQLFYFWIYSILTKENNLFFNLLNLDLAEVMSVSQANPTPGAPKKTDDKSFFDVSNFIFLLNVFILYTF